MWKHEKRTTDRRNRVRQKRDEVPFEEPWSFEEFWAAFLANGGVEEISGISVRSSSLVWFLSGDRCVFFYLSLLFPFAY
jgi:hypothetical protein